MKVIENTHSNKPADYSLCPPGEGKVTALVPPDCAGLRLDVTLARLFPQYSRSRLQAWLREGRVHMDGRLADTRTKAYGGERLDVDAVPDRQENALPEDIALSVVFEDHALLVIDKPAGLVVHPGNGNWNGTLMNALLHHAPTLADLPRAGIVHRLDKDTSGLLVVAKTLEAQASLVRQLQARTVGRRYLALVHGTLARDGEVDAPIARHPVQRKKMAVLGEGRPARTHYAAREQFSSTTLIECRLETGRTHQIRVHMAHVGHPLVGDPVYGLHRVADPVLASFGRQALHAFHLELIHPSSQDVMGWFSPLPEDFSTLLHILGQIQSGKKP